MTVRLIRVQYDGAGDWMDVQFQDDAGRFAKFRIPVDWLYAAVRGLPVPSDRTPQELKP